jgi:lycopene beta-cyclase
MMQNPFFSNKQILVIDKSSKTRNDRTWCFWEKQSCIFDSIIHHKWKEINFYASDFSSRFDIAPYEYKMIRGIDLYNCVLNKAKQQSNIHFLYGEVESLSSDLNKAVVTIDDKQITADYIFNSIIFKDYTNTIKAKSTYYLLQHFKGWLVETDDNIFDDHEATFMDFRVSQQHGTTFIYVLPVAPNKALIEYTLFTEKLLDSNEYDIALNEYLKNFLKTEKYKILETEFGVIPMTNIPFSQGEGKIVNIGTAGNQTKASSGFTFQFIQKHSNEIIEALIREKDPHFKNTFLQKRFNIYDNTLLNILCNKKLEGDKIFSDLFCKNPVQRVFRFLDNETNLVEELKLLNTVSTAVFLPSAVQELFK